MNAKNKSQRRNQGVGNGATVKDTKKYTAPVRMSRVRAGVSIALLSVLLGACSSVPNAVNPVKWYEKTTNFFSGDAQAAKATQSTSTKDSKKAQDKGLSADANAPAPAAAVAVAPGGLSSDSGSEQKYAGPPLKRQGAARDVLQPEDLASVAAVQPSGPQTPAPQTPAPQQKMEPQISDSPAPIEASPPVPQAQPTVQVTPAPVADVPPRPSFSEPSSRVSAPPANAVAPFGAEPFKTVVISADGIDTPPQESQPASERTFKFKNLIAATKPQGALFPTPGETVQRSSSPDRVGGMLRVATIHFANNSDRLDGRDRSILGAVVQLQRERGGRVIVVGHASQRTRDMNFIRHQMVNFKISMERADTVGNALESMGLISKSLEVQAVSDAKPLYLEVMPSGEAGNRRVEVYLAP